MIKWNNYNECAKEREREKSFLPIKSGEEENENLHKIMNIFFLTHIMMQISIKIHFANDYVDQFLMKPTIKVNIHFIKCA